MQAFDLILSASSAGRAVADDGLKDHDNLSWLYEVEPSARADWRRRLQWVRLVDRMAEEELLYGHVPPHSQRPIGPERPEQLGVCWCEAWHGYVEAIRRYHQPNTLIPTHEAHHDMLLELSGNIFCLFPEVDWILRRPIAHFGALDQFFNDLRDLAEDSAAGLCHFPLDVLSRFGLEPRHILDRSCLSMPGYALMMRFWLDEYLPALRAEAAEFSQLDGLPRGLSLMRTSFLRRYARIERAFRACAFDFVAASDIYWSEVERELTPGENKPNEIRNEARPRPRLVDPPSPYRATFVSPVVAEPAPHASEVRAAVQQHSASSLRRTAPDAEQQQQARTSRG